MDELSAWDNLLVFARTASLQVQREMSIPVLRKIFAKHYHPRRVDDDHLPMQKINGLLSIIAAARAKRELCGEADASSSQSQPYSQMKKANGFGFSPGFKNQRPQEETATTYRANTYEVKKTPWWVDPEKDYQPKYEAKAVEKETGVPHVCLPGLPEWQTDPLDGSSIVQPDYSDLNFIRQQIYSRSKRFGDVELLKAWAWDGNDFQKVIAVWGNDFAHDELGRALLYYQSNNSTPQECKAIFLTRGSGRIKQYRILTLRIGRFCEDVSKYGLFFVCEPDTPNFRRLMQDWIYLTEMKVAKESIRY